MNIFKSIPVLLLSFLSIFMFVDLELAYSSFSGDYETQIFNESNESKVKKLQEVFKWLGLYNWEINWEWQDIETPLINYQIQKWIVMTKDDEWAWYFWAKTMKSLEDNFWQKYLDLKEQFLKVDTPANLWKFVVTAYYTPEPGQQKYTTWSYSWDLKLNWNHTTASGLPLEAWLLAAPRNYWFGTKIYLEGLWVWFVGDRGWAIVNSWERGHSYDRLDLWVWYWDEWRERAKKWWIREITWYIVDDSLDVNMEFDSSIVPSYSNIDVSPEEPTAEKVQNLQKFFKEVSLYDWEVDWDWEKTKNTLIKYQISSWIIFDENDEVAGYLGPKTYQKLLSQFWWNSNWWLFIEKYLDAALNWSQTSNTLTDKKKQDIEQIKVLLNKEFEKIFNWNTSQISIFKTSFKKRLLEVANSEKYSYRRLELEYLVSILD